MPRRRSARSRLKFPPLPPEWTGPWVRYGLAGLVFCLVLLVFPRWWAGRDASDWYAGDEEVVLPQARAVAAALEAGPAPGGGVEGTRWRGDWTFEHRHLATLGLLQACLAHPEQRAELLPVIGRALDTLRAEGIGGVDTRASGASAASSIRIPEGPVAGLGYLNLLFGLHRLVAADSPHAALNDALSAELARRLTASRHGILESRPGEAYPADNAAVLGSLLLHQRVGGINHAAATAPLLARFRLAWRHPRSGLLFPQVDLTDGQPAGVARAGVTAMAALWLAHGERELARDLYLSVRDRCADTVIGFGFINEFHIGLAELATKAAADETLLAGVSPAATVAALGSARRFGERHVFVDLYRTIHLAGLPSGGSSGRRFLTAGPEGNALLLAALTSTSDQP